MTTARKDVQTAIVLQGGGALGAYEYGVLRALYEQRPGFRPVAVAGVSIGAITAAVLGGARTDPIAALDALWRAKLTVTAPTGPLGLPAQVDRSLALLGNPGMYQLRAGLFTAPWLLTSFYDTAPLRTDARRARRPRAAQRRRSAGDRRRDERRHRRDGVLRPRPPRRADLRARRGQREPAAELPDDGHRRGSRTGTAACSPTPRSARRSTRSSRRRAATAPWSASSSSSSCSRCGRRCRGRCRTSCNG